MKQLFHGLVTIHKHQLTLADSGSEWQQWRAGWLEEGVGGYPGGVTLFTRRADGPVPLTVELLEVEPPPADRTLYTSEKIASITVRERLEIAPLEGKHHQLAVGAGSYAVSILGGNEDTATYDDSCGSDFYRVRLWRENREREPALSWALPAAEERSLGPRLPLERARELSFSDDVHEQLVAVVELARHGSPLGAVALAPDSPATLQHVVSSSFELMRPLRPELQRALIDELAPELRGALLRSLRRQLDAVEDSVGEEPVCDLLALYALLGHAFQSMPEPHKAAVYEQLLRFQSIVESIRYQGLEYPNAGARFFFDRERS